MPRIGAENPGLVASRFGHGARSASLTRLRPLCTAKRGDANDPSGTSGGPAYQADDHQQDDRADDRVDDRRDHADAKPDAQSRQQPARDHRPDDADNDVADQSEAEALHNEAGEPARNRSDDQPSNQTFDHDGSPPVKDDSGPSRLENTRTRSGLPAIGAPHGTILVTSGLSVRCSVFGCAAK